MALKINSLCSDFSQKFGPVRTVTAGQVRLQLILRDCSYEDNRQKCWEWCGMLGQGWIRWEISQMPGIQYWHAFAGWWFQFFCIFKQKSSVFGRIIPASSNVFFPYLCGLNAPADLDRELDPSGHVTCRTQHPLLTTSSSSGRMGDRPKNGLHMNETE